MKKNLFALLTVLVFTSLVLIACSPAAPAEPAPTKAPAAEATEAPAAEAPATEAPAAEVPATEAPAAEAPAAEMPKKIAFFVSDLSNVFHQAQFTEAKKYAQEKYGAEVFAFDGKSDCSGYDPER